MKCLNYVELLNALFNPVRQRLEEIEINNQKLARLLCKLIPAYCPFARDIKIFGKTVLHIPPLCKLNPLYEQLMALRFRSLSYLADICGEDVTAYC
ncbi:MAG: Mo-dependent nitrogenase C-terminal domain-containing protein [Aulosira sp. ZfuVER01]|nr:Mo-dependent nitrogenase C-terminal domain-containing protein [Aulosira sp. ZfuVER01]MDZ7998758.1 Mo-dependent nitrogenase C-terminal domain-containing protein [Aulosira sp. DedVER01a]MDZ8053934.1 Mo-dependent nitrogenase C-terminal domain-containing protein [Aulosira sp. ZfuCHP01]